MEYITGFLALAFSAVFAAGPLAKGKTFAVRSRLDLAFSAADAALALAAAHLFMPWSSVSPWLWLLPVAVFAVGVAGAVLRWPALPALRTDKTHRHSLVWAAVHVIVLVGLLFLVFG